MATEQMQYLENRASEAYKLLVETGVLKLLSGSDSLDRKSAEISRYTENNKPQIQIMFRQTDGSAQIYYLNPDNTVTATKVDWTGPNKGKLHVFATLSKEQAEALKQFVQ